MSLQESIRRILREEKLYATPQQLIKSLPDELKKLLFKHWEAKQNPEWHPEGNTLKHILVVIKRAYHHYPNDPNMIMAALFHDLGKMDTYAINPKTNQPTAYGHEEQSTKSRESFVRCRSSMRTAFGVSRLVHHRTERKDSNSLGFLRQWNKP